MNEHEYVTFCLRELLHTNGTPAAQTLYRILDSETDKAVQDVIMDLCFIEGFTRGMADAPENWTEHKQFSEVHFDQSYLDPERPSPMMRILKDDVLKMDGVYEASWRVEGAQDYLRSVAVCAYQLRATFNRWEQS